MRSSQPKHADSAARSRFACVGRPSSAIVVRKFCTTGDVLPVEGLDQTSQRTPPGTAGFSTNYLVQVAYQDSDSGSTVLPYYNASNPSIAYSGPANSGAAQSTIRKGVALVRPSRPSRCACASSAGSFWAFAILIAVFATGRGLLSRALSVCPLVFLGEISFSKGGFILERVGEQNLNHLARGDVRRRTRSPLQRREADLILGDTPTSLHLAGPAAAGEGEPGSDPLGVFAHLFEWADARAERVSGFADRLRIAGEGCERYADGLQPRDQ